MLERAGFDVVSKHYPLADARRDPVRPALGAGRKAVAGS